MDIPFCVYYHRGMSNKSICIYILYSRTIVKGGGFFYPKSTFSLSYHSRLLAIPEGLFLGSVETRGYLIREMLCAGHHESKKKKKKKATTTSWMMVRLYRICGGKWTDTETASLLYMYVFIGVIIAMLYVG